MNTDVSLTLFSLYGDLALYKLLFTVVKVNKNMCLCIHFVCHFCISVLTKRDIDAAFKFFFFSIFLFCFLFCLVFFLV